MADDEDEEIGFHVGPSFVEVSHVWLDRCRWSVSGFGRLPGVKTFSFWKPERG